MAILSTMMGTARRIKEGAEAVLNDRSNDKLTVSDLVVTLRVHVEMVVAL